MKYIFTINSICSFMPQSEALRVPLYGIYPLLGPLNSFYSSVMGESRDAKAGPTPGGTLVRCAGDGEALTV